jgi:hypothetical protein
MRSQEPLCNLPRCLKRYVAREIYTLLSQADEQKHARAA